ncbi:hypothetical protein P154DRAFT_426191 [Amniculicola lignicola CBS 123094]|uniref:PH domain-containing protein n=1 Tax=Amniculicola lignicola CBS 123094 TaxID=1392246 RepID=A0A6A5WRW0_9PLEO|nr:hypothetical protein P154DRAFT_426191 [Amniculicola lignicola CBS 123094]
MNLGHGFRSFHNNDSSTTSRWRRNKSTTTFVEPAKQPTPTPQKDLLPKPTPKLERSPSKMSLFNLFSKPKVEKARGHTEVGLAVPMQPAPPPKPAPPSPPKSALRVNPSPQEQQVHRTRSSSMLRPISMKPTVVKRQSCTWDPPPLFQAYPQSIKHSTVQSCVFSPDVLLRTQSQRRQYDLLRERMDSHRDLTATLEGTSETKKLEKTHRRLISNAVVNPPVPQLTSKLYVLVTSGYVLQYSGEGPLDRLPEKVLPLGKDSKAFACDLIPGKHWVLQISSSADEDGTVTMGPRHSTLLSRFRLQNSTAKRSATSFLLVLESAEEMDMWMTAVRKEIEGLGGMKAKNEPVRESTSIEEETQERRPKDVPSHRYNVQRDPRRVSKITPVDSPLQSQYSDSPKIVASDWEGDRSERTVSITDSSSLHSSRTSSKRKSVEVASIATTAASAEQFQLDQLRERSRFSYMSTSTSISIPGTRNTSRTSSPAPTSPIKEEPSPVDFEPLRSATSLRSFHMNPNTTTSNRRRSMQPLPVTNEDNSLSAESPRKPPQRHSIYGPTSPTIRETPTEVEERTPATVTLSSNPRFSTIGPMRSSVRSSSAPPTRHGTISPPPRDPAPPPGRPQSTIGTLSAAGTLPRQSRRLSTTPKPFLRPFPIRPQNTDGTVIVPRRYSSLSPPPIPLAIAVNRSVTTPARTSSTPPNSSPKLTPVKTTPPQLQPLRRPASVQIRSDPAPFLSSSRPAPVRAIASTPSFVQGQRASVMQSGVPMLSIAPSMPQLRQSVPVQATYKGLIPMRSMSAIGLGPPAPPPNMPLPPPPPSMPLPMPPGGAVARALAV